MKSFTVIYPSSVEEVQKYFDNIKHPAAVVLYKPTDTVFVLNPFGGGATDTQEISLVDGWEITEEKLKHITIIEI